MKVCFVLGYNLAAKVANFLIVLQIIWSFHTSLETVICIYFGNLNQFRKWSIPYNVKYDKTNYVFQKSYSTKSVTYSTSEIITYIFFKFINPIRVLLSNFYTQKYKYCDIITIVKVNFSMNKLNLLIEWNVMSEQ